MAFDKFPFQSRHYMRHRTADDALLRPHIPKVFAVKGRHIHIVAGCLRENLGISGPAKALVSLGAVRGNIQEIVLLTPEGILKQLVDLFHTGFNASGLVKIAPQMMGGKVIHTALGFLGRFSTLIHIFHLHIAETIEGKMRSHMALLPIGNEMVFRHG